ncbi:hypothetical protein C8R31_106147 [Nitrosospira sp. Nsp2]|nr:hypothetical protein C8R31_106147 [Nitrosospira sp. Nsp2]
MKFEWLLDEVNDTHLLCVKGDRSLFFRGKLSGEINGRRIWQPFPKGEPKEVSGDLEIARRRCESMVRELAVHELALA